MYSCKAEFNLVDENGCKGKITIEGEYPVFKDVLGAIQDSYKTKMSIERAYKPEETEEGNEQ